MPKMIASHDASWRGRAILAGNVVDVSDAEAAQLAAHGFRETEEAGSSDAGSLDNLSRKALLQMLRGRGAGNLLIKQTDELRQLARKVRAGEPIAVERERSGDGGE